MSGPHPSLTELSRQIALIIQNVHTPMMSVKPNVPGVVDVGGLHITSPKPLPQDIQNFLDNAQHGVIYFSFGKPNASQFKIIVLTKCSIYQEHKSQFP